MNLDFKLQATCSVSVDNIFECNDLGGLRNVQWFFLSVAFVWHNTIIGG